MVGPDWLPAAHALLQGSQGKEAWMRQNARPNWPWLADLAREIQIRGQGIACRDPSRWQRLESPCRGMLLGWGNGTR